MAKYVKINGIASMVIMRGVLIITKAHVTTHPIRIYLQQNMINSICQNNSMMVVTMLFKHSKGNTS
jgi:hypothetical protein